LATLLHLKLSHTNYLLWREQALALIEIQKLVNHLTNEDLIMNARIFAPRLTEADIVWRKVCRNLTSGALRRSEPSIGFGYFCFIENKGVAT